MPSSTTARGEASFQGKARVKPVSIDMEERENYPDTIYDKVYDLDGMIKILSYDDLAEVLEGRVNEKKEETKTSANVPANPPTDNGEKEEPNKPVNSSVKKNDRVLYKGKEWDVMRVSTDGNYLTLEDDDGKTVMGIPPDDVKVVKDVEEDKDEQETSASGDKPDRTPPVEEDDEEDEEEEDLPKPRRGRPVKK